jgi:hypothetical protein
VKHYHQPTLDGDDEFGGDEVDDGAREDNDDDDAVGAGWRSSERSRFKHVRAVACCRLSHARDRMQSLQLLGYGRWKELATLAVLPTKWTEGHVHQVCGRKALVLVDCVTCIGVVCAIVPAHLAEERRHALRQGGARRCRGA